MSAVAVISAPAEMLLTTIGHTQFGDRQTTDLAKVRAVWADFDGQTFFSTLAELCRLGLIGERHDGGSWRMWLTTAGWDTFVELATS